MKRCFEFRGEDPSRVSGKAEKFWEITLETQQLSIRFGKIGAKGQTTLKSYSSPEDTAKEFHKLIEEKVRKGYVEVGDESESVPQRFCTECGTPRHELAKFCASCGVKLGPAVGTTNVQPAPVDSSRLSGTDDAYPEVLDLYNKIVELSDFDPSVIEEETFLGIVYAALANEKAAKPTKDGVRIINSAKQSLSALYADLTSV